MIIRRTFIGVAALAAALHSASALAADIKIGASGPLTSSYDRPISLTVIAVPGCTGHAP